MQAVATSILADTFLEQLSSWIGTSWIILKVAVGFSLIIFVHELGHFLAAKWARVRVDRFAIGFGPRVFGWRKGEGLTFGRQPEYDAVELERKRYGETDYCLNVLPLGGYVKMLGQNDIIIDEETDEVRLGNDPRSFNNRPVGARMIVASAGVVFNFLFAIFLLMLVFLVGVDLPVPVIGQVEPFSPAAKAGLQAGDVVLTVDGTPVDSFVTLQLLTSMAESGDLNMHVSRADREMDLSVEPELGPAGVRQIGVRPKAKNVVAADSNPMFGDVIKRGDVIVDVDGVPVHSIDDALRIVRGAGGRTVIFTVERPESSKPDAKRERIKIAQRARLHFAFDKVSGDPAQRADRQHLLGLIPRTAVGFVDPDTPASSAGFKAGDIIVEWGAIVQPREGEIRAQMAKEYGEAVHVVVERDGKRIDLNVTPQSPETLVGGSRPQLGVYFQPDQDHPIVADVADGTPAVALKLPRGAQLLSIADKPVATWTDIVDAYRQHAGQAVPVRFRSGTNEAVGEMHVPSSILDEAGISPLALIFSVNGQRKTKVGDREESLPGSLLALKELLNANIGKSVELEYVPDPTLPDTKTVNVAVTPDNADPWQLFTQALYEPPQPELLTAPVSAHGNPITALQLGFRYSRLLLAQIISTMKHVSTSPEAATKNLAGPIGIAQSAYEHSKVGLAQLLFFLAILSANLAVINFLPLPVLDGGLMVFLILEKIRGKPLTLRTQMISTLVGLAVIAVCFLFVMVQDISRLF